MTKHDNTGAQEHKSQAHRRSTSGIACALHVYLCTCALVLFLSGCTQVKQLQNLDPLLTLKDFSDEKDSQQKWVDQEVARFELLLAAIDDGSIKSLTGQDAVLERFGEPVVIDEIREDALNVQRWLYRHPIQKLATDRVYFYFDANGHLLRSERVGPSAHDQ